MHYFHICTPLIPEFVAVREQQKQYQVWGEKNVIWKQDFLLVARWLALLPPLVFSPSTGISVSLVIVNVL